MIVPPTGSLHRSNAIHRRRRGNTNDDSGQPLVDVSAETDENVQVVARPLTDGDTVVDERTFQDDYSWNEPPPTYQRSGQNIVQLLFRVSEDATRRNAYVHRGCACNSCNMVPIRGIRYRCANCADFDLCEGCEAQGFHNKTHIFYKIKVPAPSFGPRTIQPVWYTGDPDSSRVLSKNLINKLSRETGFERPELDAYWEQWTFMANYEWREDPDEIHLAMDRKTFERCLVPSGGYKHSAPSLIFDRMFAFYDANNDDLISFPEFLHGLAYRKKRDKWRKIFEGYDIDNDGYVDRKDFLRIFRSYYVLYREMHRDMLESMDEQQMSSADAHRLVSGRQPLSSAFGADGRYPSAPEIRAGQGKTIGTSGDAEISDGKGVVNENGDDSGNREEAFTRRVTIPPANRRPSGGYWEAMLNPPTTVEQMPDVIRNLRHSANSQGPRSTNAHPILQFAEQDAQTDGDDTSSDLDSSDENDENWLPSFVTVTDEDAEAVAGPGCRVADLLGANRDAAIAHALERGRVRHEMTERWKRRQFYTDEEEGATAPVDWNENDDILGQDSTNGEGSKAPSRPSVHSRSSSKVRFAENIDDFDTRSNPSTSSRSIPERWGGMDIPDAEKDAGKEILFQVTQQAFNELLDPFFKGKENLAFLAAETRSDRQKYRHIWDNDWFDTWATEQEDLEEEMKSHSRKTGEGNESPVWHDFEEMEMEMERANGEEHLRGSLQANERREQERDSLRIEERRQRREREREREAQRERDGASLQIEDRREHARHVSLAELLEITGITIDESLGGESVIQAEQSASRTLRLRANTVTSTGQIAPDTIQHPRTPTELFLTAGDFEEAVSPTSAGQETPGSSASSYHDPTMPQFRPNSTASVKENSINQESPDVEKTPTASLHPPRSRSLGELKAAQHRPADLNHVQSIEDVASGNAVAMVDLLQYWRAHRAEKEKYERGGWGRLNFKEWEKMVKTFAKDGKGNQMDYLGSWIECCIP
jgi:Ca2+-binding EF-hand superfamily protein